MKKVLGILIGVCLFSIFVIYAYSYNTKKIVQAETKSKTKTFLLLVKEQNIEGPQRAWWSSEIDLSTVEAKISQTLTKYHYKVISPSELRHTIKLERSFQTVNITEGDSVKLAKLKNIDYVVLGKAIASAGAKIIDSNMYSCFANATVKLIRVSDGKIIAYLDATASSPHTDLITGGKQALAKAGIELGNKIVKALAQKEGNNVYTGKVIK